MRTIGETNSFYALMVLIFTAMVFIMDVHVIILNSAFTDPEFRILLILNSGSFHADKRLNFFKKLQDADIHVYLFTCRCCQKLLIHFNFCINQTAFST